MRNLVRSVAILVVSAVSAVGAFATPIATSSPPADAVALVGTIDLSNATSAALLIIGALIAMGVTLWGARLVFSKFRPKI